MSTVEIMEQIKRLPRGEQEKIVQFARELLVNPVLSPDELGLLAERMVSTRDPAEADRLQEEIVRGFYGRQPDA